MTKDKIQSDLRQTALGRPTVQDSHRPRLLFLAYCFPPLRAVGSVRTGGLAKYLARLGWEVTVVTPHPSLWRRTDNPEKIERMLRQEGLRRITSGLRWRCLDPDYVRCWNRGLGWVMGGFCRRIARRLSIEGQVGWVPEIEKACRSLGPGDADVILATGNPYVSFRAARLLGQRLGVPFVLDYRDPWNSNPHAAAPQHRRGVEEEEALLRDCAAATIVSSSLAIALQRRFPIVKDVRVVPNGYDPEDLAEVEPHKFGHFAIVYAGSFYHPKRVITPVMKALQKIALARDSGVPEWRFHYLGASANHVVAEAEQCGIRHRVIVHGQVPREEALSAVAGANASVVIASVQEEGSIEDRGIVTGKVFDAIGLGTPVLGIAPRGSDLEIVMKTAGRGSVFQGSDVDDMATYVAELMAGRVPPANEPDAFAWPNLARQMDAVLQQVVRGGKPLAAECSGVL